MTSPHINSQRAPEPVGPYPHARRVGNLLFLSGVGPRKRGEKAIRAFNWTSKARSLLMISKSSVAWFLKTSTVILEEAGSHWDNLVDVTVFLTNLEQDFSTYNRLYAEYFKGNQPCRTTVGVSRLPTPIAIELKCIATID